MLGHAAYCDTCDKFDGAMRTRRGIPHCRTCGTAIPWPPRQVLMDQHWSEFLFGMVRRLRLQEVM